VKRNAEGAESAEFAEKRKKKRIPHCSQRKALSSVRDDMNWESGKGVRRSVKKRSRRSSVHLKVDATVGV
jgi:hypothetical protein